MKCIVLIFVISVGKSFKMKKGDILLIHYRFDPFASLIRFATKSYWNHVAICIDNDHVLEVRGHRIQVSPIRRYVYNDKIYKCKVVRCKRLNPNGVKKAISYMIDMQEEGYLKWAIACIMTFLNLKKELPRHTCSGLIAEAFETVGFYFKKSVKSSRITPSNIAKSRGVKYITGKELYRILP